MKTIGQVLSTRRKEMNLSIEDVSSVLKIKPRLIESMENDNCEQYISPIYYQGFLKQYTRLLDIEDFFNKESAKKSTIKTFESEYNFIDNFRPNFLVATAAFVFTIIIYLTSSSVLNKKGIDLLTQEFVNKKTNFAKLQE